MPLHPCDLHRLIYWYILLRDSQRGKSKATNMTCQYSAYIYMSRDVMSTAV